ncbi:hypothetical protein KY290_013678 [Solanum tuberosum]|uniref:GAG-pre-integrase domain-containing protein n=1 Tax=Solanum tuberosum TaxID=4113 RepID=A0ABQ7VQ64_SOLTU|nr:hypothetical protein KY290_013678 [Solanum tuberosum]
MDSGCLRHMTGDTLNFLSLEVHQGGGVSFGGGKNGSILGIGKIRKTVDHSIVNVHYVNGLKFNLLSVSQMCDKGNEVKFLSDKCLVINCSTNKVVMIARRVKNMYVADLDSVEGDSLSCLSAQAENVNLWHRRLGHVSASLLNKLVAGDLVRGLPKLKFSDDKVCDACEKGKQTRSTFKPKKGVSTTRASGTSQHGLVWTCKNSKQGRFTWNMFLRAKDETTGVLITFAKAIKMKVNCKIASIRSDHGTEFENSRIEHLYAENGINHNFSTPRTSQ